MNSCATCKHRERGLGAFLFPHLLTCKRPNRPVDPVTGKLKRLFCNQQRVHGYGLVHWCGSEGKYWEPK